MNLTFSNSPLWSNCPMSCSPRQRNELAEAYADLAEHDSPDAQEGQAAHWAAKLLLYGNAALAEELVGKTAPSGWTVDDKMARHVQGYVDTFREQQPLAERDLSLWDGMVNGRTDAYVADSRAHTLYVRDFKYGHRIHEPQGNAQLLLPAIALRQPHHTLIHLSIYQPRPWHPDGPYRKWIIGPQELAEYERELHQAAVLAYGDNPTAIPGRWCEFGYCPKAHRCGALAANLNAAYEMFTSMRRSRPQSPEELGHYATWLKTLGKLVKAADNAANAEIYARIRQKKEFIPGWHLTPKTGHRDWTVPLATRRNLLGHPCTIEEEMSPAQMEDAGFPKDVVNALCKPKDNGLKLAEFHAKDAERAFGK